MVIAIQIKNSSRSLKTMLMSMDISVNALYPVIYNFSFILAEAVLTLIVINIPAVRNALNRVRMMAVD